MKLRKRYIVNMETSQCMYGIADIKTVDLSEIFSLFHFSSHLFKLSRISPTVPGRKSLASPSLYGTHVSPHGLETDSDNSNLLKRKGHLIISWSLYPVLLGYSFLSQP